MNHAEKVKKLAQKLAEAHNHYCNSDDGEPADYALEWRREAVNNLHAAIDEMQAEIDRLTSRREDALRYCDWTIQEGSATERGEAQTIKSLLNKGFTTHALLTEPQARGDKAMAELQKEAQERGDYGIGGDA